MAPCHHRLEFLLWQLPGGVHLTPVWSVVLSGRSDLIETISLVEKGIGVTKNNNVYGGVVRSLSCRPSHKSAIYLSIALKEWVSISDRLKRELRVSWLLGKAKETLRHSAIESYSGN